MSLPDPDDAHVLAAAVLGRADVIVTVNVKDFPVSELSRFGVELQTPDEFLMNQLDLDPQLVVDSLVRQAEAMRNPELTVSDLLDRLSRANAPRFAHEAGKHLWRSR